MIASLCVLSYMRPDALRRCLDSLFETVDYPCEIIVNCDGGDTAYGFVLDYWKEKKISKVILNNGQNRGVGRSLQNCLAVAEGDYIFKIDADLTFQKGWLSSAIKILDSDSSIGALGLFDYNKWDPNDSRFKPGENVTEDRGEYQIVKDFVSSIYCFKKEVGDFKLEELLKGQLEDDGVHQHLKMIVGNLALKHCVENTAFGVHKSTYVSGTEDHPFKTPTSDSPFII